MRQIFRLDGNLFRFYGSRCFGFIARKPASKTDNQCHIFAELEAEQPATAIVNFVTKVMMTSSTTCRNNVWASPRPPARCLHWTSVGILSGFYRDSFCFFSRCCYFSSSSSLSSSSSWNAFIHFISFFSCFLYFVLLFRKILLILNLFFSCSSFNCCVRVTLLTDWKFLFWIWLVSRTNKQTNKQTNTSTNKPTMETHTNDLTYLTRFCRGNIDDDQIKNHKSTKLLLAFNQPARNPNGNRMEPARPTTDIKRIKCINNLFHNCFLEI